MVPYRYSEMLLFDPICRFASGFIMKGLICSSGATCKEDRDFWKELLLEYIRVELILVHLHY
jgi:hypothetical protein